MKTLLSDCFTVITFSTNKHRPIDPSRKNIARGNVVVGHVGQKKSANLECDPFTSPYRFFDALPPLKKRTIVLKEPVFHFSMFL